MDKIKVNKEAVQLGAALKDKMSKSAVKEVKERLESIEQQKYKLIQFIEELCFINDLRGFTNLVFDIRVGNVQCIEAARNIIAGLLTRESTYRIINDFDDLVDNEISVDELVWIMVRNCLKPVYLENSFTRCPGPNELPFTYDYDSVARCNRLFEKVIFQYDMVNVSHNIHQCIIKIKGVKKHGKI